MIFSPITLIDLVGILNNGGSVLFYDAGHATPRGKDDKKPLPDEEEAISMIFRPHLSSIRLLDLAPCYIVTVAAGSQDQVPPPTLDKENELFN